MNSTALFATVDLWLWRKDAAPGAARRIWSHYSLDDGRCATVNIPRTAQVAWWGLAIRLWLPGSAHTQRRLACPAAENLNEVGGVRESRASSNLGRGQTIEER